MQTRRGSIIETFTNIVVGLMVSIVANAAVAPLILDHAITGVQNIKLTFFYTIISMVRSYALRRSFNKISIRYGI